MNTEEKFASLWRRSREDAGKSQDYVAKALGVSKKTVQNWESGDGCPSQIKGFQWFEALDLQPLPYYLSLLYGEFETIDVNSSDENIDNALYTFIKALPTDAKRKLLYWAYGNHGSSPMCVMELVTAHLQTPLRDRVNIAQSILTNYRIAKENGTLARAEHIQPNDDLLRRAMEQALESTLQHKKSYTMLGEEML